MAAPIAVSPSRPDLAAFGGAVLIGGSNFVAVKLSNTELAPMYGAALRFTGAAAIFGLLALALSVPLPRGAALGGDAIYGALAFGGAYGAVGALMLWIASVAASEPWTLPSQSSTWLAVVWLATAGSVGLFYLVLLVIQRWTASAAVYSLALTPVVAIALGAVLAGEPVTIGVVAGAAIVLLGVYVGAIRRPTDRARTAVAGS